MESRTPMYKKAVEYGKAGLGYVGVAIGTVCAVAFGAVYHTMYGIVSLKEKLEARKYNKLELTCSEFVSRQFESKSVL